MKETRTAILDGTRSFSELIDGKPGEIKAEILEEDGKIVMKKTCEKHGTFTDVMAIDPQWLERIERLYPGPRLQGAADAAARARHARRSSTAAARCSPSTSPTAAT